MTATLSLFETTKTGTVRCICGCDHIEMNGNPFGTLYTCQCSVNTWIPHRPANYPSETCCAKLLNGQVCGKPVAERSHFCLGHAIAIRYKYNHHIATASGQQYPQVIQHNQIETIRGLLKNPTTKTLTEWAIAAVEAMYATPPKLQDWTYGQGMFVTKVVNGQIKPRLEIELPAVENPEERLRQDLKATDRFISALWTESYHPEPDSEPGKVWSWHVKLFGHNPLAVIEHRRARQVKPAGVHPYHILTTDNTEIMIAISPTALQKVGIKNVQKTGQSNRLIVY